MSKRAVLYARVSYDDRDTDGRNLKGQMDMCREYAQAHGYEVVAELAEDDRGASGASFELPELGRMRELAETGQADVVVTREIDRLSRRLAKQLVVEEELKRHGVVIEYVLGEYPDTPEGNLMKNVRASVAEYEREKINERMTRARRLMVKAGNVLLHGDRPPYGYRVIEVDGKVMLAIYEPEARIVRLIFLWYTVGDGDSGPLSMYAIAQRLSAERVPTRGDDASRCIATKLLGYGMWSRTAVYKILGNETYAGVWHYGKYGAHRPNSRDTWLAVKVPAIVDREPWEAAQERMIENKDNAPRNTKHQYLLRRRVTCGECGCKMNVQACQGVYLYYRCVTHGNIERARDCALTTRFRADHVDTTVWAWVKSFFTDPAALAHGLQAEQADRDEVNRPLRQRLAVVDDLLADNRKQLNKLLDLYLAGDFPREMLTERKTRLETTIGALDRERAGLAAQIEAQTLTSDQVQTIVDFAATIQEGLAEAEADFTHRRRLIEMLDVWVTLAIEDGQKVAYVRCMLGERALSIASTTTGNRCWSGQPRCRS